ncbi:MAG TPA: DNA base-flipping protein YbaZ, partial [Pseudomonas sp.]|nr:DNA base-flipping protein YbaZ [Pseudomonas sp.]
AAGHEQRMRLRAEGLTIVNDRVDMRRHGWHSTELNG